MFRQSHRRVLQQIRPLFYQSAAAHNNNSTWTLTSAQKILGLDNEQNPSATELRAAYFAAAKQCHPDVAQSKDDDSSAEQVRLVTEAYEFLSSKGNNTTDDDNTSSIPQDEEARYRRACLDWLGQPAEVVEESKRCPLFRQWLMGRTDSAAQWKNFFMQHGGLAPMLRRSAKLLTGTTADTKHPRRKRTR